MQGIAKYSLTSIEVMSLIVTTKSMQMQDYEQTRIEQNIKNEVHSTSLGGDSWEYVAGLSWLFLDDDFS